MYCSDYLFGFPPLAPPTPRRRSSRPFFLRLNPLLLRLLRAERRGSFIPRHGPTHRPHGSPGRPARGSGFGERDRFREEGARGALSPLQPSSPAPFSGIDLLTLLACERLGPAVPRRQRTQTGRPPRLAFERAQESAGIRDRRRSSRCTRRPPRPPAFQERCFSAESDGCVQDRQTVPLAFRRRPFPPVAIITDRAIVARVNRLVRIQARLRRVPLAPKRGNTTTATTTKTTPNIATISATAD